MDAKNHVFPYVYTPYLVLISIHPLDYCVNLFTITGEQNTVVITHDGPPKTRTPIFYTPIWSWLLSSPLIPVLFSMLLRGGIVIRTHDGPQKTCIPLCIVCLHTTFGPDYCVPPDYCVWTSFQYYWAKPYHTIPYRTVPYHTIVIGTHDGPKNYVFPYVHTPYLDLITMFFFPATVFSCRCIRELS